MTLFRSSILAIALAASAGMAGGANAAGKDKHEDPSVRHCTNDPNLASTLYEYLRDCPAAQGLLNESGQWVAVERGSMSTPSTAGQGSHMSTPSTAGQGSHMSTPGTAGQGSTMGTPSAPGNTGGTMGTPSAPGGSSMSTPSTAGQGGKAH